MNLAIVVAVSDYGSAKNNLPACKNDASLIKAILRNSGRFENMLVIDENTSSTNVKNAIAVFLNERKGAGAD
jgi:hypothetical protein